MATLREPSPRNPIDTVRRSLARFSVRLASARSICALAPCDHSWIEPNIAPRRSLQLLNFSRRIRVRIRPAWVRRFELRCDAGSPLGAPPAIWAAIRKQSGLAEKIILTGHGARLCRVTQIRVRATCQRDEFSLCTSKFESDMASHAVGLRGVISSDSYGDQERRHGAYLDSSGHAGREHA